MKYWTDKDLEYVRSFLPTDVTAEMDEISQLEEGDFFNIIIRRYGASVCLELSQGDAAQMPIISVREDRGKPWWSESFGKFDNAIRRCVELMEDPTKIESPNE